MPSGSVSFAFARFRSAPSISSGGPVMTVGKNRVTPVECSARIDSPYAFRPPPQAEL